MFEKIRTKFYFTMAKLCDKISDEYLEYYLEQASLKKAKDYNSRAQKYLKKAGIQI